jgi:putative ABC transport system permease protein
MNVKQSFKLAIKSILSSKFRSFLTMLGIIIGVAAVIVLVSLVNGFSKDMAASFEALGTNLISVSIPGRGGNVKVSPTEVINFALENTDTIAYVSPTITVSGATIKYGDDNLSSIVYGTSEDYDKIKNYEVEQGRFIGYVDVEKRQKVCLLGKYVANELFSGENPIDKEIKINGERYTVVGVLKAKQGAEEGSTDDMLIIPYTAATRLSKNATVSAYLFSSTSKETVEEAMSKLENYLMTIFNNNNYYRVYNQADSLEKVNELSSTLTMVLVGVAAISLLVGGIGIMNIMLVSVTERTKEIGIRKSLGGKRRDIMMQFVIEAATTSAIGGIIGIIFGCAAAVGIGKIFDMSIDISYNAIIIAFSVSVGIGIIFGYFPASKASKLNPIEALRYD